MWICICNALRCRDIRQAVTDGAETPSEVFQTCQCEAQCGMCVREIVAILREPANIHPLAAAAE
jgi:bacterioferritin-associated ferredoxin